MYNQAPTVGRINPAFSGPQDEQDHLEKSRRGQSVPSPYYPNVGYQTPRVNPIPSGYPNQPYGAPGGPQDEQDHLEKSRRGQSVPPPYYPNVGYQTPRVNAIPSGYPNQPYGAPAGPQGPYAQQPYPWMSAYPQGAYVGQTGVTVQPNVFVAPGLTAAPDYLGYSIFTMLFCCLPLGIAAVIYSCYTRDANLAGQQELAMSNSRAALILNNVALSIGLTITVVAIVLIYTL